jgi:hypothetical protein
LTVTEVTANGVPEIFEVVTTPPVFPPELIVGAIASGAPPIVNAVMVLFPFVAGFNASVPFPNFVTPNAPAVTVESVSVFEAVTSIPLATVSKI